MTAHVVGRGGDRIDRIARKVYGSERDGAVERLLDANPGLAAAAPDGWLAEGTAILAPPVPVAADDTVRVWE